MLWVKNRKKKDQVRQLLQETALSTELNFRQAIDTLQAANRFLQSTEIENHLVSLRHEYLFHIKPDEPKASWPPSAPDNFSDSAGIPQIKWSQITPQLARSAVFNHGSLVIRDLLTDAQIATLRNATENTFKHFQIDGQQRRQNPWFVPFVAKEGLSGHEISRKWVREGGGVLAAESPRSLFQLIEVFQESGITELVTGYLGERPALSVKKTTLRVATPETRADVGWHQDGAFLGENIRTLNVWLALTDCGIDAPSMDMIPRRLPNIVPTGTEGAAFHWSVSPLMVDAVCAEGPYEHLLFKAGDAIIFDEFNLHRTSVLPEMTQTRLAVEAWFFAPSCYPLDQLPIMV